MNRTMTTTEYRATIAARMPERELLERVRSLARVLGLLVYHTHDSRRSEPGFPDLVIAGHGRVLYAELKTQRGRLTDAQRLWISQLQDAGSEVHLWRPQDLLDRTIAKTLGGGS